MSDISVRNFMHQQIEKIAELELEVERLRSALRCFACDDLSDDEIDELECEGCKGAILNARAALDEPRTERGE